MHDRELMVVKAATGIVLTQGEILWMALVRPYIETDYLSLAAPGMPELGVMLATSIIWPTLNSKIYNGLPGFKESR